MKNLVLFAVLTVFGLIGLSSCQSDGNVTTPTTSSSVATYSDAFSATYTLPSDVTNYFSLNEGTLEKDMTLCFSPTGHIDSADTNLNKGNMPHKGDKGKGPGHGGHMGDTTNHGGTIGDTTHHSGDKGDVGKGIDIGRTLHQLQMSLTADQKVKVGDALKAYQACMKTVMDPIKQQRDARYCCSKCSKKSNN